MKVKKKSTLFDLNILFNNHEIKVTNALEDIDNNEHKKSNIINPEQIFSFSSQFS